MTRKEWRYARQRGVNVYPVKGCPEAELDYACLPNWMRKVLAAMARRRSRSLSAMMIGLSEPLMTGSFGSRLDLVMDAKRIQVDEMKPEESVALLASRVPTE